MIFEKSGIETLVVPQSLLHNAMNKHGLVLGGHWDYERMTFDFKYEVPEGIYYLRFPGYAIEGDVGGRTAVLQLMEPYMGKHYMPTGMEYGEDEHFPDRIVSHAVQKIRDVYAELEKFAEVRA